MQTKHVLTSVEVTALMAAARADAAHRKLAVSIAVVDDGGHPLALERTDNAAPVTAYVAIEKARTAALCRRESKAFEDMINGGRVAWLSVPMLNGILEGGVPVMVDGAVLGAVGVSGASPADDASIAQSAADALRR
ncbi:heme-binding protein [Paraburkholderia edwinii]|jgi:glc operon protein GlcG|uniref:Heme-binding protein n=1 Tax=Paraburkholderia edwinii TaxID=2861782 RepID=A0ABX8URJ4_9BURK|nr:heme-binding protein [Paraburkholderia edwinii]QYD71609.1 heme-binding protein [Paraburkholderia edwinii]